MKCTCDDCDQNHCSCCGGHTVGNTLLMGMCQDCFQAAEDQYNEYMNMLYQQSLKACRRT